MPAEVSVVFFLYDYTAINTCIDKALARVAQLLLKDICNLVTNKLKESIFRVYV